MSTSNRTEADSSGPGASKNPDDLALHVLHSLDQPICIIDPRDCFLFANKAFATHYGVGLETLRGQPIRDLIGETFYDKRIRVLLARARLEGVAEFHGWIDFPERGRRYMESDFRLYSHPDLADRQCLMIQLRDITDREELDRHRRKSLHFQEDLLGQLPAMVWICSEDGVPYFYNNSWLDFTGTTLVEQVRKGWVDKVHPEDREVVTDRIHYAIENREEVQIDFRMRYLMGGYRWVRLYGRPASGLGESNRDYVVSALDIDDNKTREHQMRTALAEERHLREQALLQKAAADRANREKSAYLSLASHEIRTPMNPVIGFADLLASNPDLDGDSKEMAQMILKAGKNLLTLLDEVLDYAKIEAGVLKLAPEPVDVHDFLIEIDNLFSFDAKSRGIELRVSDRLEDDQELFQDRLRLQQVLGTLITNAIKMTHTGHVSLEASASEMPSNGNQVRMLQFAITDTGVGMNQAELEKLFQPFAHPDTEFTDKYAGTGLGLAITQKLIDAMQGTVQVDSSPGKGTRVQLVIPFAEVPPHLRKPSKHKDGGNNQKEAKPEGPRIIIVDDEESSRVVNSSLMRFLGHPCDTVSDGRELMERLRERRYEIILMDIMMPGLDGLEATRRIRNGDCGERNREAFIVAVTACAQEEDRERGLKSGINAYLTKPVTIEALRDAMSRVQAMGRSF